MAHQVMWSPTALEDIEAIANYISRDSVSYASTVVRRIINSTRNLESFPFAGRIVPELALRVLGKCLPIATGLFTALKMRLRRWPQ